MGFSEAVQSGFSHYADFNGRASRPAYWWWFLFTVIVSVVANILDAIFRTGMMTGANAMGTPVNVGIIGSIASLALLLPSLGIAVRRLHDTDRSGWWLLVVVIPLIGWLVLIYFYIQEGTPGTNRFGPPTDERALVPTIN